METNSHIKMAALAFLFIVAIYVFFVYSNLQSTYVQDIANNSEVYEEGFNSPEVTEGFQNENVVEGFKGASGRDVKRVVEKLETAINQYDDSMRISKYRKEYEELISKSDELFELVKLRVLLDIKDVDFKKNPMQAANIAWIMSVISETKPSLESLLNYIESK